MVKDNHGPYYVGVLKNVVGYHFRSCNFLPVDGEGQPIPIKIDLSKIDTEAEPDNIEIAPGFSISSLADPAETAHDMMTPLSEVPEATKTHNLLSADLPSFRLKDYCIDFAFGSTFNYKIQDFYEQIDKEKTISQKVKELYYFFDKFWNNIGCKNPPPSLSIDEINLIPSGSLFCDGSITITGEVITSNGEDCSCEAPDVDINIYKKVEEAWVFLGVNDVILTAPACACDCPSTVQIKGTVSYIPSGETEPITGEVTSFVSVVDCPQVSTGINIIGATQTGCGGTEVYTAEDDGGDPISVDWFVNGVPVLSDSPSYTLSLPATNTNCEDNTTLSIEFICGETTLGDALGIAHNCLTTGTLAFSKGSYCCYARSSACTLPDRGCNTGLYWPESSGSCPNDYFDATGDPDFDKLDTYDCEGNFLSVSTATLSPCGCTFDRDCLTGPCALEDKLCKSGSGTCDSRSSSAKWNGCCPEQLLYC